MVSSSSPLILNQLKFYKICIFAIIPPLCGIIAVISVAIWLHSSLIFGYKWSCGVCHTIFINFNFQTAYLPSISRLLNLPVERIIWNFVICLHLPFRFVITLHYYCKFFLFYEIPIAIERNEYCIIQNIDIM